MCLAYNKNILLSVMDRKPDLGKTAIMKVVYMLQQVKGLDLCYRFDIYTYGPYTAEVTEDLEELISYGLVDSIMHRYDNYIGYNMKLSPAGKKALTQLKEQENCGIAEIIDFIDGKSAKELELFSTIVFISGLFSKNKFNGTQKDIIEKVHEIKPHFNNKSIKTAYMELLERKYISA
ncbi:MAG: hypothetical protein FWH57_07725 [Oscillospiraceae bacterium]|nr:hypothetical protein [Oscillospiraceae bacterium]